MRAFFAIDLSLALRELLAGVQEAIRREDPNWQEEKWVSPRQLHVTLAFMPDIPREDISGLLARVGSLIGRLPCGHLRIDGIVPIPDSRRARMIWASFKHDEATRRISEGVLSATSTWRDPRDGARGFRPHVTLARARRPKAISEAALNATASLLRGPASEARLSMSVECATLYASTLGPSGPTYESLGAVRVDAD